MTDDDIRNLLVACYEEQEYTERELQLMVRVFKRYHNNWAIRWRKADDSKPIGYCVLQIETNTNQKKYAVGYYGCKSGGRCWVYANNKPVESKVLPYLEFFEPNLD